MTDQEIIQANIKRFKAAKGISSERLSFAAGLSRSTINRACGGADASISMHSISKIAQALEVTLLDLVTPHETTPALQDLKRAALQAGEGSVFTREQARKACDMLNETSDLVERIGRIINNKQPPQSNENENGVHTCPACKSHKLTVRIATDYVYTIKQTPLDEMETEHEVDDGAVDYENGSYDLRSVTCDDCGHDVDDLDHSYWESFLSHWMCD